MIENDPIKQVEDLTREVHELVAQRGKPVFARYPILFSLLATFGLSAVLYGLQELIDEITFLNQRPVLLLVVGLVILLFTGSLYKRLSDAEGELPHKKATDERKSKETV